MNARLALRLALAGGRTRLRVETQEPPWKVVRAFPQSKGAALAHLHNLSGGVLAGDHLSLEIDVGVHAAAQVTSTGATRLYRHREGARDSEQHIAISVAEGGLLEYLPDMLIPFAHSRHAQRVTATLARGATFFWWETLAPGRLAMGESFAFDTLRIENAIHSPAGPLALENLCLDPRARPMPSPARMGSYLYTASFYAIQIGRAAADLRSLEASLNEIARDMSLPGVMIWGASALASDGIVVRGLSTTARHLPATLVRFWSAARRFLTGEEAVPPRKLK